MRIMSIAAALLIVTMSAPLLCDSVDAQDFKKRGKKEGRGGKERQRENAEQDIDAPVNLNKFPGVGSIDAWKTSVPEFREGMNKMREHSWDDAIAHFRASIALYEYQPHAWLQIGKAIEAKSGLIADAEKAYRHCVRLDNQSWQGWKALANVLYMQKRYDEAREAVSNALDLNAPQNAKVQMRKIVQMIDSAQRDSNTQSQNTAQ